MADKTVTIWTRDHTKAELGQRLGTSPNGHAWSKETFEDLGWDDWVRTHIGFYIGSGPGEADMKLASTVDSTPSHDGSRTMDDTMTQLGGGNPQEREKGADPVYLGIQLSALAKGAGQLHIVREP